MTADQSGGKTRSTISGGTQQGPVLQGRDFRDIHIGDIVQAAAVPVALAQLPPLVAGFTSRETELAQITALLDPAGDAGTVVVSAVAGLAGVGKTALAVQAARIAREAGWFGGGVLFIDLHGYDDVPVQPGQALDALLRALGVRAEHIPAGGEERAGLYRSKLADITDPVLIIADNASAEAQVRLLLPGPGPHRVIVTSRHTLAGLGARLLDVTVLDDQAGMALLDAALRAARPDDDRIDADQPEAARLAGICGGLPLALQITAALLNADPSRTVSDLVGDLAGDLADEMRRLDALAYDDGGGTSAPSVAAAFELSYRRLDEAAARVFRLLPVNPGPDTSTAAVAALADVPVGEARTVIGRLVRAHLLETAAGAAGRWRMHDLLRLYAGQLSDVRAEADRREEARDRLLGYFLDTVDAANDHLRALPGTPVPASFTSRDDALTWLDAERPSLVAAVTVAASTGRDQIAMQLPLNLSLYLRLRREDDLLSVAVISRDAARRLGDQSGEAEAVSNLGSALRFAGRYEEAITAHREDLAIRREIGDRHGEGTALADLGITLWQVPLFEQGIIARRNAAAIFRETGDRRSEGTALTSLALALGKVRRFEEGIAACQDAAVIFGETGDRYGEGKALDNLSLLQGALREVEEAIIRHQKDLALRREVGDRYGEGTALTNLSRQLRDMSRDDEAIAACQDAAAIFQETGDRRSEGKALDNLGFALAKARRFEEAIAACQDAVVIFREADDRYSEGTALINLGLALREAGRFEEAIAAHQDAAVIFQETGYWHSEDDALANLRSDLIAQGMAYPDAHPD